MPETKEIPLVGSVRNNPKLFRIEWADGRTDPEGALEWFSVPRLYTRAEARLVRDAIDCLTNIQDTRLTEETK